MSAQEIPINRGSTALWQSLKKLHTRASLIMVTAHPDDEDGGMLVYESRGQGARVTLLTLNRGEGGANVMSRKLLRRARPGPHGGIAGGGPLLRRGSILDTRRRLRLLQDKSGIDRQVDARSRALRM